MGPVPFSSFVESFFLDLNNMGGVKQEFVLRMVPGFLGVYN